MPPKRRKYVVPIGVLVAKPTPAAKLERKPVAKPAARAESKPVPKPARLRPAKAPAAVLAVVEVAKPKPTPVERLQRGTLAVAKPTAAEKLKRHAKPAPKKRRVAAKKPAAVMKLPVVEVDAAPSGVPAADKAAMVAAGFDVASSDDASSFEGDYNAADYLYPGPSSAPDTPLLIASRGPDMDIMAASEGTGMLGASSAALAGADSLAGVSALPGGGIPPPRPPRRPGMSLPLGAATIYDWDN